MKRMICLIETDDTLRALFKQTLEEEGYDVEDHNNAYPLFEVNRSWPDLFLMEIRLESINGLEICRWIKSHDETSAIPVILLCDSPELQVLAADAKADLCIMTPFDQEELIRAVQHTQHLTVL